MKDKFKPLKIFLAWVVVTGGAFVYALLVQLIISFIFTSVIHMNIHTMIKVSVGVAVAAAVIYPLGLFIKSNKKR